MEYKLEVVFGDGSRRTFICPSHGSAIADARDLMNGGVIVMPEVGGITMVVRGCDIDHCRICMLNTVDE